MWSLSKFAYVISRILEDMWDVANKIGSFFALKYWLWAKIQAQGFNLFFRKLQYIMY